MTTQLNSLGVPIDEMSRGNDYVSLILGIRLFLVYNIFADAQRIVDNSPHTVSGLRLDVSLVEEREDESANDCEDNTTMSDGSLKIIVSGISSPITNDSVKYYFENSRRSGGGAISDIFFAEDGDAWITFQEVKGTSPKCSILVGI